LPVVADDDDDDDDGLFIGQIYTTHVTIRTYDSLLQLLGSCWIWSKSSCSQHVYSQRPAGRKPFHPCGDNSPFILDISSGSKWNVHILLYPLCPVL